MSTTKLSRSLRIALMQLPPPLHGMSKANAAMQARLFAPGGVEVIDLAVRTGGGKPGYLVGVLLRHASALARLIALRITRGRAGAVYFAFSGGERLLLEVALLHAARLLGARAVFCHHHSYAYLDERSPALLRVTRMRLPAVHHIVQTPDMREAMLSRYGNRHQAFHVLGNAWIVERYMGLGWVRASAQSGRVITVGLLSNLTPDKGLRHFLSLARTAVEAKLDVCFSLAGPCSAEIRAEIDTAAAVCGGQLVYAPFIDDAGKPAWFGAVDLFFFASTYLNEANPLVLLEALAAGCVVLSTDRGSIATTLGPAGVLAEVDRIEAAALALIAEWRSGGRSLERDSQASIERFGELSDESAQQLATLARLIEGDSPV